MQHVRTVWPFEIVRRDYDGMYIVYEKRPWPDDVLDNDSEQLKKWLTATKGWRAYGWIAVYQTKSSSKATRWVLLNTSKQDQEQEDETCPQ